MPKQVAPSSNEPVTPAETAPATPAPDTTGVNRLTKLKTAFLYVLIAGLAAAAITSVAALLIGQFNSSIAKALLTITIFFTHSLVILAILWADRYNQVGKLILPTTIVALVFANIISTTLGTWEIISTETAWRIFGFYFLILGAAFIITGLLRLRLAHQGTQVALYASAGLIVATIISLAPWVLQVVDKFDPLYFRIVGALSILATTSFLISLVIYGIAIGRNESLKLTIPKVHPIPGGFLAIYITAGVITAIVWSAGLTAFLVNGIESASPADTRHERSRYY